MKKNILFILLFSSISSTIYFTLNQIKDINIQEHLNTRTYNYQRNYNALYHEFKILSNVIYNTNINTKEVVSIFKDAATSTKIKKELIRDKLYKHLGDTYTILKKHNLRQLHFHLPNNESFLRFHKIEKYGDDLTQARESVNYVNKFKEPIDGFEEGKVYNGYRFVFPLFYKDRYIGSVEISFGALAMSLEFLQDYNQFVSFLTLKKITDKKAFKDINTSHTPSQFKGFHIETEILNAINKLSNTQKTIYSQKTKDIFNNRWDEKQNFSIYDTNIKKIITFIKVQNPVTSKIVAIFSIKSDSLFIENANTIYLISLITLNILLSLILLFIYKELKYRKLIEENNKKLNSILNGADSGIALMDLDGNFLKTNQAYSELLGYTKQEFLHLNCNNLTKQSELIKDQSYIKEAISKGSVSKARKTCITKFGNEVHLEFSLTLLPAKNALIALINSREDKLLLENLNRDLEIRVAKEIDKNRKKEKKFQEQSRLAQMGEMINMIAHQWRQPLSAISSSVISIQIKIMSGRYDLDSKEDREEFLKFMEKNHNNINEYVQHLSDTIDDFRDFFKPDKQKELVPLNQAILRALNIVENSLNSKNIVISSSYKSKENVLIYQNEMMQVILNILKNAEDNFIERDIQDRQIDISTSEKNSKYIIEIKDNGGGIDSTIISKIFDPYYSTKLEKNGTGLGLYMSKMIIQKHNNGTLEAINIDNGVNFKITLQKDSDV